MRVRLVRRDGQVDPAQDLAGALVGVDRDVQVADVQGGHAMLSLLGGERDVDVVAFDLDGVDGDRLGRPAGPVGWPVRRSKQEPCSQHSTVWP